MSKARDLADIASDDVIATTATGVDVTGTVTADGLNVAGASKLTGLAISDAGTVQTGKYFHIIPNDTETNNQFVGARVSRGTSLKDAQYSVWSQSGGAATITSTVTTGGVGGGVRLSSSADGSTTKNLALFKSNNDVSFYEDTGTTPKFFWDASAEALGIGDTSPLSPLFVNGNTAGYDDLAPVLWARSRTDASIPQINVKGDQWQFGGGGTLDATPTMTVDYGSGNLLVGKISASSSVQGTIINNAGLMYLTPTSGDGININRLGTTGSVISFRSVNVPVGSISVTGSATAYNTSSDYRLKENITPVQGAADIVKAMQPVTYTFKSDGSWHDGFLAHELQELHPRAVTGSKDAMMDEEYEVTPAVYEDIIIPAVEAVAEVPAVYDDEGVLVSEVVPAVEAQPERTEQQLVSEAVMGTRSVPDYQGVDYSKLTPILTAALQEALNKIDALEARLTALEGTV